jgi:hypothetical protein
MHPTSSTGKNVKTVCLKFEVIWYISMSMHVVYVDVARSRMREEAKNNPRRRELR